MLLLYTPDATSIQPLIDWLRPTPYVVRIVGPYHAHHTLEVLTHEEEPSKQDEPATDFSSPFLYIDLDDSDLEQLLRAMRKAGLRLRFKAKKTEHNSKWSLSYLLDHVAEEAEEMELLHLLHRHRQAAEHITLDASIAPPFVAAFREACERADALLKDVGKRETPSAEIKNTLDALIKASLAVMPDD